MVRLKRLVAIVLLLATNGAPLAAQTTPAPPEWKDNAGSVYLGAQQSVPTTEDQAPMIASATAQSEKFATTRKIDSSVVPSVHTETALSDAVPERHLAPPGTRVNSESVANANGHPEPRRLVDLGVPTKSLYTMGTGLAIVVGSFLLFAWVLRRGGRNQGGRNLLPADAVSVVGRVSLTAKQVAQLLRVGNKLVLVALTPNGAETLTEITDPVEVDRLMGLCQQSDRHSTTKAFEQVFQSLSREPAQNGFLGGEALPTSLSPAASAYRSHRGESGRV